MNYYIITGTSRGLGEAIAVKLLNENNYLICISRTNNSRLIALSEERNGKLSYFEFDLNNINEIDSLIEEIFQKIDPENIESMNLINNAGTVTPIKAIDKLTSKEIVSSFNVNMVAPAIITSKFIAKTANYNCEKRIINISSGAAKKPYDGWSTYCSSKAGLEMLTRSVSVEQDKKEFSVKVLSFDPGIIDTDMQNEIRKSNVEDFSQLERFKEFHKKGSLLTAEFVAVKLIKLLEENSFISGEFISIWDMIK